MINNYRDDWSENKVKLYADAAEPGKLAGQVHYNGYKVSNFTVVFDYDESGTEIGFMIDVPFRQADDRFDDDDIIAMIESGVFEQSTPEFDREWLKAIKI